ncbi:MAG: TonB family protein [Cyclobacteriaceae bacterium]|nr:TonB family protein [Cyclobacteriaceae bacterium]
MENKKHPAADLQRKRPLIFLFSLSLSISLAIMAFEWRTPKGPAISRSVAVFDIPFTAIDVPLTRHEVPQPARLALPKASPEVVPDASNDPTDEIDLTPPLEADEPESVNAPQPVEEPEDPGKVYVIAEVAPVPAGGYGAYYDFLKRNMRYPMRARAAGIEGSVYVQFIVGTGGHPEEVSILKGIGGGCDEEAVRVIRATRWEAGRQRGRPVRVKMVIPVVFRLGQ